MRTLRASDTATPVEDSADIETSKGIALPEDARERKRVLNVLAQRRYRRRKKHRQAVLEDMLIQAVDTANHTPNGRSMDTSCDLADGLASGSAPVHMPANTGPAGSGSVVRDSDYQLSSDSSQHASSGSPDSWFMHFFLESDNDISNSWPVTNTPSLSNLLQVDEVQNTTFSDDYHLAVPELDLLRASFEIASRMNTVDRLWDLTATSVFQDSGHSQWAHQLPGNLQPTKTQLSVSHHPILDLIPWPSARDKLINMYSMPPDFWPRHPDDGSECSVIRLVYDMEAGGIRIWGADPASETAWEIGESLFAAWWWALDGKILLATNRRRIARGQQPLQDLAVRSLTNKPL